jgi:hypothetical protein
VDNGEKGKGEERQQVGKQYERKKIKVHKEHGKRKINDFLYHRWGMH